MLQKKIKIPKMSFEVSDELERKLPGIIFNFPLSIYKSDDSNDDFCIVSINSFVYGFIRKPEFRFFWRQSKTINYKLRHNLPLDSNELEIVTSFNFAINLAPRLTQEIIIYRGLPCDFLCDIGDTLSNLGFMFGSIYQHTAMFYATNDTTLCYLEDGRIDNSKTVPSKKSTIFKITLPSGTHFYNKSYENLSCNGIIESELVLSYTQKLSVLEIFMEKGIKIIRCCLKD